MLQLSRRRYTDLPGAVGASVIVRAPRVTRHSPKRSAASKANAPPTPSAPAPAAAPAAAPVATPVAAPAAAPAAAPVAAPVAQEETHWMYAYAKADLTDCTTGSKVLAAKAKGVFVFPMVPDDRDTVYMRLKTVHPTTGQLAYHWVVVYNGETAEHTVEGFCLT